MPELGSLPWLLSRALGVAAYASLTLEVALGLSSSTRVLDRALGRPRVYELHRWLSGVSLGLLCAHALVLLADTRVTFTLSQLLVPFWAPVRPVAVGLGVLAAYLGLVVHASHSLRRRLGAKVWRRLHGLTFVVYLGATAHGLLAGTDAGEPWMRALYLGSVALVLWLAYLRVFSYALEATSPSQR